MITARRIPFHLVYLGFVLCVLTVSFFIVRSSGFAENTDLLSLAVTLDVVLLIPGVYFLLAITMGWQPIRVNDGQLELNTGLRWRCSFPLSDIGGVELTTFDIEDKEGLLNAAVIGNQNILITMTRPHEAIGLYGFRKEFDRVAVTVDEPALFAAALVPTDA